MGLISIPTWVTADTHWNHRLISRYSGRPENHNEIMIQRWNEIVAPNESILHLGDLAMGLPEQFDEIAPQLNGVKYIVKGNHDRWPDQRYEDWGFKVLKPYSVMWGGWVVWFTHYPKQDLQKDEIFLHGHVHNNPTALTSRHINVGVDVRWGGPVRTEPLIQSAASRNQL